VPNGVFLLSIGLSPGRPKPQQENIDPVAAREATNIPAAAADILEKIRNRKRAAA
jgi:hypothetical protein